MTTEDDPATQPAELESIDLEEARIAAKASELYDIAKVFETFFYEGYFSSPLARQRGMVIVNLKQKFQQSQIQAISETFTYLKKPEWVQYDTDRLNRSTNITIIEEYYLTFANAFRERAKILLGENDANEDFYSYVQNMHALKRNRTTVDTEAVPSKKPPDGREQAYNAKDLSKCMFDLSRLSRKKREYVFGTKYKDEWDKVEDALNAMLQKLQCYSESSGQNTEDIPSLEMQLRNELILKVNSVLSNSRAKLTAASMAIVGELRKSCNTLSVRGQRKRTQQHALNIISYASMPPTIKRQNYCEAVGMQRNVLYSKYMKDMLHGKAKIVEPLEMQAEIDASDERIISASLDLERLTTVTSKTRSDKLNSTALWEFWHDDTVTQVNTHKQSNIIGKDDSGALSIHPARIRLHTMTELHKLFLESHYCTQFVSANNLQEMVLLGKAACSLSYFASTCCNCIRVDECMMACADTCTKSFDFVLDALRSLLKEDERKGRVCSKTHCLCKDDGKLGASLSTHASFFKEFTCSDKSRWYPPPMTTEEQETRERVRTEWEKQNLEHAALNDKKMKSLKIRLPGGLFRPTLRHPPYACSANACTVCKSRREQLLDCLADREIGGGLDDDEVFVKCLIYEKVEGWPTLIEKTYEKYEFLDYARTTMEKWNAHYWHCKVDDFSATQLSFNLPQGCLLLKMDFAAQLALHSKYEATSSIPKSATLHVACAKFGVQEVEIDIENQKLGIAMKRLQETVIYGHIGAKTEDISDNSWVVYKTIENILLDLLNKGNARKEDLRGVYLQTDGCAKQYKNKFLFAYLSDFIYQFNAANGTNIQFVSHQFHTTSNGKGECDGAGGSIKNFVRAAEIKDTARCDTPWEMFKFLKGNKSKEYRHPSERDDSGRYIPRQGQAFNSVNERRFVFTSHCRHRSSPQYSAYNDGDILFIDPSENGRTAATGEDISDRFVKIESTLSQHEFLYLSHKPGVVYYRQLHCNCTSCLKQNYDACLNINTTDSTDDERMRWMFTSCTVVKDTEHVEFDPSKHITEPKNLLTSQYQRSEAAANLKRIHNAEAQAASLKLKQQKAAEKLAAAREAARIQRKRRNEDRQLSPKRFNTGEKARKERGQQRNLF